MSRKGVKNTMGHDSTCFVIFTQSFFSHPLYHDSLSLSPHPSSLVSLTDELPSGKALFLALSFNKQHTSPPGSLVSNHVVMSLIGC